MLNNFQKKDVALQYLYFINVLAGIQRCEATETNDWFTGKNNNAHMEKQRVCPWWLGYTFILPVRKFQHDPEKILGPHVNKGMKVMDYGCAMGYFSIPLAQMTGAEGKVYCVDIQDKMLTKLLKRAKKFGVSEIIKPLQVGKSYEPTDLHESLDFVLLFAVAHEVPDKVSLFKDLFAMLKQGGRVLFAEPSGHVSSEEFKISVDIARKVGFTISDEKPMNKGLSAFLQK